MEISEGKSTARPTTLYVCVNLRTPGDMPSCGGRGAVENAEALEKGIRERRIDVRLERIVCFGKCPLGPNMRLAPGGTFFFGVGAEDLPQVLDRLEEACGSGSAEAGDAPPLPPPGT